MPGHAFPSSNITHYFPLKYYRGGFGQVVHKIPGQTPWGAVGVPSPGELAVKKLKEAARDVGR